MQIIQRLRETKVLENYSFMTALSIFSALIGIIIYPYVIRVTGKDAYGIYVYSFAIASFFQVVFDYGFESPCAKAIVQARNNLKEQSYIVSCVLLLKTCITVICGLALIVCIHTIPFMHTNWELCLITFVHVVAASFFPTWYFQGLKKMKVVTYINLAFRLSTIPLILLIIHSPRDIILYALIVMASVLTGTIVAFICLYKDGVRVQKVSFTYIKKITQESTPFFATALTCELKNITIKTIIKQYFGIGEVAVYDFAEKIISIPHLLTLNINSALFPEVVDNASPSRVRRILKYERIIGASLCALISLCSYPAVLLLGGNEMMGAVPLTIILSAFIYTRLIAGAYINFVFIPANRYYFITINQIVALVSCVLFAYLGVIICNDIKVVALCQICSGFIEILFCRYLVHRYL